LKFRWTRKVLDGHNPGVEQITFIAERSSIYDVRIDMKKGIAAENFDAWFFLAI